VAETWPNSGFSTPVTPTPNSWDDNVPLVILCQRAITQETKLQLLGTTAQSIAHTDPFRRLCPVLAKKGITVTLGAVGRTGLPKKAILMSRNPREDGIRLRTATVTANRRGQSLPRNTHRAGGQRLVLLCAGGRFCHMLLHNFAFSLTMGSNGGPGSTSAVQRERKGLTRSCSRYRSVCTKFVNSSRRLQSLEPKPFFRESNGCVFK
jgi:hypothetical protein